MALPVIFFLFTFVITPFSASAVTMLGERWFVRAFNIDDNAYVYVNDVEVAAVPIYGDSGWVEVTDLVASTGIGSQVRFILWNGPEGYSWGFEVGRQRASEQGVTVLWSDVAGVAGTWGANRDDQTRTFQWVYDHTLSLRSFLPNSFSFPLPGLKAPDNYPGYAVKGWLDDLPSKYHTGTDTGTSRGAGEGYPVVAAGRGVVVKSSYEGKWGWVVVIAHRLGGQKLLSQYAHLYEKPYVVKDQFVFTSQPVGKVGGSGGWPPHLHFEIKVPKTGESLLGHGYSSTHPDELGYLDPYEFIVNY